MNPPRRPAPLLLALAAALLAAPATLAADNSDLRVVLNPYQQVDWDTFEHHKAALHVHTLQSDGYHMLDEVTRAYRDAGFTILAITDHDIFEPNRHVRPGRLSEDHASPYPDPQPPDYPANTTWPWTDFGAPAPEDLNMLGIQAAELTSKHHMNSFFTSYGVPPGQDVSEDQQLHAVHETGGVVFLDHPGIDADWWTRRPLDWYIQRFETHSPDYLLGLEVVNAPAERVRYDEGVWDQLLARFMPRRPIWGFGTDDMHQLESVREADSVFLLDQLNEHSLRHAMQRGQFYFRWSSRRFDLRDGRGPFPAIQRIDVDNHAGTITLHGSDYDTIKWISAPPSLEPKDDFQTSNEPWHLGRVVHEGPTLNFRETEGVRIYVRAELHHTQGEHVYRTFTQPFGLGDAD